jgi:hypothetical protein
MEFSRGESWEHLLPAARKPVLAAVVKFKLSADRCYPGVRAIIKKGGAFDGMGEHRDRHPGARIYGLSRLALSSRA